MEAPGRAGVVGGAPYYPPRNQYKTKPAAISSTNDPKREHHGGASKRMLPHRGHTTRPKQASSSSSSSLSSSSERLRRISQHGTYNTSAKNNSGLTCLPSMKQCVGMPVIVYTGIDQKYDGCPGILVNVDNDTDECDVEIDGAGGRIRVGAKCVFAVAYGLLEARAKAANDKRNEQLLRGEVRAAAAEAHKRQVEEHLKKLKQMEAVIAEKEKARVLELAHKERKAELEARAEAELAQARSSRIRMEMEDNLRLEEDRMRWEEDMLRLGRPVAPYMHKQLHPTLSEYRAPFPHHPSAASHGFIPKYASNMADVRAEAEWMAAQEDVLALEGELHHKVMVDNLDAKRSMEIAIARAKSTLATGGSDSNNPGLNPTQIIQKPDHSHPAGVKSTIINGLQKAKVLAAAIQIKQQAARHQFLRTSALHKYENDTNIYKRNIGVR